MNNDTNMELAPRLRAVYLLYPGLIPYGETNSHEVGCLSNII